MGSFVMYPLVLVLFGMSAQVYSQGCPSSDWELFDGSCYRYYPGVLATWDDAQTLCSDNGGNLASLSSVVESTHIYEKMLQHNPLPQLNNYWIGMSKEGAGFSYEWIDESPVIFTEWAVGEPSDQTGAHNCVQVLVEDGIRWDDTDCLTGNGFVCKTATVQQCPSADWDPYGDSCYRYYPAATQTGNTAELVCTQQDAHLASLLSDEEAIHVHDQMITYNPEPPLQRYWIGLYRLGPGNDFGWTDGSMYDYQRWASGEPNNYLDNQYCVMIRSGSEGEWDDDECEDTYGFVCKKPQGGKWQKGQVINRNQDPSMNHLVDIAGQASQGSIYTDGISPGATAGVVLGGLVVFVCVGTLVFMIIYRRKKRIQQNQAVISVETTGNHI